MQLITKYDISIRSMDDSIEEFSRMLTSFMNPAVSDWYENREGLTIEEIAEKYRPRIYGKSHVHPAIIEWKGKPIG